MQNSQMCGKMETNQRWLVCPHCRKQKLGRMTASTKVKDLFLFCKRCNREVYIAIEPEP